MLAQSTNVHVSFSSSMPDTNYTVELTPDYNAALNGLSLQVGIKSPDGFDAVVVTPSGEPGGGTGTFNFEWTVIENN